MQPGSNSKGSIGPKKLYTGFERALRFGNSTLIVKSFQFSPLKFNLLALNFSVLCKSFALTAAPILQLLGNEGIEPPTQ